MNNGLNRITGTDEQTIQELKNHVLDLEQKFDSGDGIVKKIQLNGSDVASEEGIVDLQIAVWRPVYIGKLNWTYNAEDAMFISTNLPTDIYNKCSGTAQSRLTISRKYAYHAYPLTNKTYVFGNYHGPQLNVKDTEYGGSADDFKAANADTIIYYLE